MVLITYAVNLEHHGEVPDTVPLKDIIYLKKSSSICGNTHIAKFAFPPGSMMDKFLGSSELELTFGRCSGSCGKECEIGGRVRSIINGFDLETVPFPKKDVAPGDFMGVVVNNVYAENRYVVKEIIKIDSYDG